MRRPAAVAAVLALALGFVAISLGRVSAASPPVKKDTISSTQCPGGHYYCYKPAALTVKKGTKVVWTNASWDPHTVTRCSKAACGVTGGTGKQTGLASPPFPHNKTRSRSRNPVRTATSASPTATPRCTPRSP